MTKAHTDDAGRLATAREKVSDTAHAALDTAGDALVTARDKASSAYSVAIDKAGTAGRTASETIEANPLVALAGGIAVGLIAGALVPRSDREAELLAPLGAKLADAARGAVGAAKQAGLASFDEAGFNREAVSSQVSKLVDVATKAATAASGAAVEAARKLAA